ncbi:cytidylyltransferase domain-containing protein [Roseateles sp.]|uniref:acylneuraminate cytidylyltransferase family protein n=1 Tax=Roseateles sp. TaxID=1971397 RepID=UPI003D114371
MTETQGPDTTGLGPTAGSSSRKARTLALIPARAGSKRVVGKNHRVFAGKPLVQWSIDFARTYPGFDRVMVSTDSPEVAAIARACGLAVPWLRPPELASDTATTLDVALHALEQCAGEGEVFERIAILQPTCPVRYAARWDQACTQLDALSCEAVVGVSAIEQHPYWTYFLDDKGAMSPCFPGKNQLRSQDLPRAAAINGALYLIRVDTLKALGSFTPPGTHGIVCTDACENIDIDTEADWFAAEQLISALSALT